MTAQEAFSFKLLASCEHEAAQYYTLASFSESIFFCCIPGGYHPELKGIKCVILHGFWYLLLKCLPSPVGALSLTASEPTQPSVFSAVDSKDSFVTTHSSKTSKDCPVGFADFGSVSVACLQFSVQLKARRCQLSVTGPHSVNFLTQDTSERP